jgi:pyrroloquinoline quinone biosynthesis protein B
MKILVLGAAAGGGLPQWNCGCRNCMAARAGEIASMTQSSVAVSVDGQAWVLLNASPDLRAQFEACAQMHPGSLRGSPVHSVVLTNGDIDHIAGLLTMREKTPFDVYASAAGLEILSQNLVFSVLDPALVARKQITLDTPFEPQAGLQITPFAVPGKVALFLEKGELNLQEVGEQTIGLLIEHGGKRFVYIPGCAVIPDWLIQQIEGADLLLFDGTVWNNDDMLQTGTGQKTGARMGHIPMNGAQGSLVRLAHFEGRKVFTHINNTNPVLNPASAECAQVLEAGWDIAYDGMEITL